MTPRHTAILILLDAVYPGVIFYSGVAAGAGVLETWHPALVVLAVMVWVLGLILLSAVRDTYRDEHR